MLLHDILGSQYFTHRITHRERIVKIVVATKQQNYLVLCLCKFTLHKYLDAQLFYLIFKLHVIYYYIYITYMVAFLGGGEFDGVFRLAGFS
ncbi:hypothetical protein skT53_33840 [Effusibacillus dendaii]|uniref:Uncharacterized protein n=1 Tax=Effusibacillus dendaii TaxID=2743772 RepID=A0A7I8DHA9_9BACL|nr:hypothetical protein skT53_33840 [Effusibacillus dendaii]